jgi:hypothetical protein
LLERDWGEDEETPEKEEKESKKIEYPDSKLPKQVQVSSFC